MSLLLGSTEEAVSACFRVADSLLLYQFEMVLWRLIAPTSDFNLLSDGILDIQ
jgi:hypothetical protein